MDGGLKSKVVFLPDEVESDLPVTMWYFEPLELFTKSLQDPQVMNDFVCFVFPRGNILIVDHVCTTRLHQLTGSMKHSTSHMPLKVECSGLGVYLLV